MLTLKGHVVVSCEENIHSNSSSRFHTASKKLQMGGHFLFCFFGYFSLRLNFDTFVIVAVIIEQNYICIKIESKREKSFHWKNSLFVTLQKSILTASSRLGSDSLARQVDTSTGATRRLGLVALLDLGRHGHEGLLDVSRTLGGSLNECNAEGISKLLCRYEKHDY